MRCLTWHTLTPAFHKYDEKTLIVFILILFWFTDLICWFNQGQARLKILSLITYSTYSTYIVRHVQYLQNVQYVHCPFTDMIRFNFIPLFNFISYFNFLTFLNLIGRATRVNFKIFQKFTTVRFFFFLFRISQFLPFSI